MYYRKIVDLVNIHHIFVNLILLLEHVAMERDVVWDVFCILLPNQVAV